MVAMRVRSKTDNVGTEQLDFRVLQYTNHDSSMLNSLGKHARQLSWKISIGAEEVPLDIKLIVDKQIALSPQVAVVCNGEKQFPAGGKTKSAMKQDFNWTKSFRGKPKGFAERNFFEVRPEHHHWDHGEVWYAATLTEQREDGLFKAILQMPDLDGGMRAVEFPAVQMQNIREAFSKKPVFVPYHTVKLVVPKQNPSDATVHVDETPATRLFARPTPANLGEEARVAFKVSKDRSTVATDIGHPALSHFLSAEPRAIKRDASDLKHSWTFQVGPFAEHTVEMKKASVSSKVMSLFVDGELLAEATGTDFESSEGSWACKFQLVGDRYVDWNLYENDRAGVTLDSKGTVTERHRSAYSCEVVFHEEEKSLMTAKLFINGLNFTDLPAALPNIEEEAITCSPQALAYSYGLTVPYKVNNTALSPYGFLAQLMSSADSAKPSSVIRDFLDLFSGCKAAPMVDRSPQGMIIVETSPVITA